MADPQEIVNNSLDTDDAVPARYIDWLGRKTEVGNLAGIRFGLSIHTSDEETINTNASELGVATDHAFWEELQKDTEWLEANAQEVGMKAGLYLQGEGHSDDGAKVCSAWILGTLSLPEQIALAKKIVACDEMVSTTSGTFWKFFPGSETVLYRDVSETGRRLLDVSVEFTGTEALQEWLKLNLTESEIDPDDPEDFIKRFTPRLLGSVTVQFSDIKPNFPEVPNYWHREEVDGLILFRYQSERELRDVMYRMKHNTGSDLFPSTYRYQVPNPRGHILARDFLEQAGASPETMALIAKTNAPIYFDVPVTEFNNYVRLVYPQIKLREDLNPDDPESVIKNYRKLYYKLFYGRKFGEGAFVGVYSSIESALQAAKERKLRKRARNVWIIEETPGTGDSYRQWPSGETIVVGSAPTGIVYDVVKGYKVSKPRQIVIESEDVDSPEGYLDRVTGWIDTFLNAGMERDSNERNKDQFWKKYECYETNYWMYAHLRDPLWLVVVRTEPASGTQRFSIPFTFVEKDTNGIVAMFQTLDRLLTDATTSTGPRTNWAALDDKIIDLEKQNEQDRKLKLSGKRTLESVNDPDAPEINVPRYLEVISPEPCFACGADLTQPNTVVRTYFSRRQGEPDMTLEGHYDPDDGYFVNDEAYDKLTHLLGHYDLPDDCDTCKACGKSTAKAGSVRNESITEPDADPVEYLNQIHDLEDITHDIQNHGMFVNQIEVWGRWVILRGGAYWATLNGRDDEEPLKADFFREQLVKFMAELGITRYHVKAGQTGLNQEHVWFMLGIPKYQLTPHSWEPYKQNSSGWHSTWLPEALGPDTPNDPGNLDSPATNLDRLTVDLNVNAILTRLGFVNEHKFGQDMWNKRIGDQQWRVWPTTLTNIYGVTRLKLTPVIPNDKNSRKVWADKGHFTCHVNELEQQLREEGALTEALQVPDPDDPSVNVTRHVAAMDPAKILADFGFSERRAYWSTSDRYSIFWEKFDHKTGLKWTAQREDEEDEPQTIKISIYRYAPLDVRGSNIPNYDQVGGFKAHVGELAKKLERALALRWYAPGYDRVWAQNVRALNSEPEQPPIGEALDPSEPVQEGAEDVTDWTEFLDIVVETGHLSRRDAIRYQQRHAPEVDAQIYALFIEMDEAEQNGDAVTVTKLLQHIARLVKVQNMRYGSAIKALINDVPLDESKDDVDPEAYIKSQPIEVTARIRVDRTGESQRFNCAEWFEHASFEDLFRLANTGNYLGFERSVAADEVALFFAPTTLNLFFQYNRDEPYEVYISREDARRWVEHNRPEWYRGIWPDNWPDNLLKEGIDDPTPEFIHAAFDVPTILKRRGYERHGDQHTWTKVFRGDNHKRLDYHIVVTQRGYGGGDAGNAVYDTTLYHFLPAKKEGVPIAQRYARNNKNLEPMLKALEARVKSNNLRGVTTDTEIAGNPEFDDFVVESVDDPDDPSTVLAAHTQDLVADPDEPATIHAHPHGEAETVLTNLGFQPSWVAGKATVFGEPEVPNFWSKDYRAADGTGKKLFIKLAPDSNDRMTVGVRTRAMSVPVRLVPRSMAHIITIIKDVDAAMQRVAQDSLPKAQEIDAILRVLEHHQQWCLT